MRHCDWHRTIGPTSRPQWVEDIIKARETGVGVNGEFVIFLRTATNYQEDRRQKAQDRPLGTGGRTQLVGTHQRHTEQVEAALIACFPKGTTGLDEANVLRTVFRHMKRAGGCLRFVVDASGIVVKSSLIVSKASIAARSVLCR